MKKMSLNFKKILSGSILSLYILLPGIAFAQEGDLIVEETQDPNYLQSVIDLSEAIEVKKSTIFDASKSFLPNPDQEFTYEWDFGDGNRNEGVEVLHAYKDPGFYTISLKVSDGSQESENSMEVFVYRKLMFLITDRTEDQDSIDLIENFAEKKGVHLKTIESYGSSTEFISEEVLTKKINEEASDLVRAEQIIIWTKGNAGLSALSRFTQNNQGEAAADLRQKSIIVLENDISSSLGRIQRQFEVISPEMIILTKEGEIDELITSEDTESFLKVLDERGSIYEVINERSSIVRPWKFMSYFVNILVNNGIPDNTIALLLLLPIIATVVAFMKQVVGVTTFGIYTPSIITLSFLVIGMHAGLLTLLIAILVGTAVRPLLKRIRMLFIPKMAIVITLVSLALLLVLIASIYLDLFDAQFLSIAIFPMLILSTLVEKFVSAKSEKSYSSATVLMAETVFVAITAYFIAGGEVDLGFVTFQFEFIKNLVMTHPEVVFLLIFVNIALGKWSGLRILERIRFREVLRHIEE
jgi:PKD repeat protein